jgi:hypothetical protein
MHTEPQHEQPVRLKRRPIVRLTDETEMNLTIHTPDTTLNIIKKKCRPKVMIESDTPAPEKMSYTSEEVRNMDDHTLLANFMRITGITELYCAHCKKSTSIAPYWINSIRKRYSKLHKGIDGLCKEQEVPKTCGKQTSTNDICNGVNNPAYSKLRSKVMTEEDKKKTIATRENGLKAIGLKPRPYRYTVPK